MNRFNKTTVGLALASVVGAVGALGWTPPHPSTPHSSSAVVRLEDDPNFLPDPDAAPGTYVVSINDGESDDPPSDSTPNPGPTKPGGGSITSGANASEDPSYVSVSDQDWVNPPDPVTNPTAVSVANSLVSQYGGTVSYVADEVGSFVVTNIPEAQARAMSHDSRVYAVVADSPIQATTVQTTPSYDAYNSDEWALDSLDQRTKYPRSGTFTYTNSGSDIDAYVLDSGIWVEHPEFGGRASLDYSAVNGESPDGNYLTHGTSVASLIGGTHTGVAKNVRLHSVKVVNKHDATFVSTVVRACNWVKKHGHKPAVVNCSFGGKKIGSSWFGLSPGTRPEEKAIKRLVSNGFIVVVSAGNDNDDASKYTPSCVTEAVTVGALAYTDVYTTVQYETRAYYNPKESSNYGGVVDLFAPGDHLFSATWGKNASGNRYIDWRSDFGGTSGASPLVAGVAAQYLQTHRSAKPSEVQAWLTSNATPRTINNTPSGTVNRVLFTDQ